MDLARSTALKKRNIPENTKENNSVDSSTLLNGKYGMRGRPSKAIQELIREFQIDADEEWVVNTVDAIFEDNLDAIKTMLDSIDKYKDVRVYKVLPSKLDKYLKLYGQAVTDYYNKKISVIKDLPVLVMPEGYIKCRICGEYLNPTKFLRQKGFKEDEIVQLSSICGNCCENLYNRKYAQCENVEESIVHVCQKADILVIQEIIDMLKDKYMNNYGAIQFSEYLQVFHFYCSNNQIPKDERTFEYSNLNGIPFKTTTPTIKLAPIYHDELKEKINDDEEENEVELLQKDKKRYKMLKNRFGDVELEDMLFLERAWNDWYSTSDIPEGKSGETMVNQLCYMELQIDKAKREGKNINKMSGEFRKFIKECGITGKKKKEQTAFKSIDMWINEWEGVKPIPKADEEFCDIDNMEMIANGISGSIARTLGKENAFTKRFESDFKDYTINFDDLAGIKFNEDENNSD